MTAPVAGPDLQLSLFQKTVLLTEGVNALKRCLNVGKCSQRENPNNLDPVSSDKEELLVPVSSVPLVPIPSLPLPPDLEHAPVADIPLIPDYPRNPSP